MARARPATGEAAARADGRDGLPSPSLTVDLDAFEANLVAAAQLVAGTGKCLRPHVKTHRTPGLALLQLREGTRGVTCATVGEAEVMARAGIDDVLIANEIVSRDKIERVVALAGTASVAIAVDSEDAIDAFSTSASRAGRALDVLVDVDVGLGRCGVRSVGEARDLAGRVDQSAGLGLVGIMGYEGRVRSSFEDRDRFIAGALGALGRVKAELESAGLGVEVVSAAGTSTLPEALANPLVTEIQAGTYALMEDDLQGLGLPFRYAAEIVATVISRAELRTVLDVGRKTIGCDKGLPIPGDPSARAVAASEEHVVLEWSGSLPELGERVRLRPSHVRTTFNLHDRVWLLRGDEVVDALPIEARGMSQ